MNKKLVLFSLFSGVLFWQSLSLADSTSILNNFCRNTFNETVQKSCILGGPEDTFAADKLKEFLPVCVDASRKAFDENQTDDQIINSILGLLTSVLSECFAIPEDLDGASSSF